MAHLHAIVEDLNHRLHLRSTPDYSNAMNGLQLQNDGNVTKVAAAVDATLPVIRKAVEQNADLLVVHHGMFWQGAQCIKGAIYDKLKLAIDNNLAIYSAHIPLDIHPSLGNNALLADAIGLVNPTPFMDWKGVSIGLCGPMDLTLDALVAQVAKATENEQVHVCAGGSDHAGNVGIVTGGAGSEVYQIAAEGINTFITGEGPHWSYTSAEELGINLIYAGHYATETFGVKAVAKLLEESYTIERCFVDHPTGL